MSNTSELMIEIRNLWRSFGATETVAGMSCRVISRSHLALVHHNRAVADTEPVPRIQAPIWPRPVATRAILLLSKARSPRVSADRVLVDINEGGFK